MKKEQKKFIEDCKESIVMEDKKLKEGELGFVPMTKHLNPSLKFEADIVVKRDQSNVIIGRLTIDEDGDSTLRFKDLTSPKKPPTSIGELISALRSNEAKQGETIGSGFSNRNVEYENVNPSPNAPKIKR